MFEIKDTLDVDMDFDKELEKVAKSNYLFFSKRWRSRSFYDVHNLDSEESNKDHDAENENFYGHGIHGQRFEFVSKDYSIIKNYTIVKKLFEDMLSPTVVTLTTLNGTQKVKII